MFWLLIFQIFLVSINPFYQSLSKVVSPIQGAKKIEPIKAWVVYTECGEGSVKQQSVISNETEIVLKNDRRYVRIEEIRNPTNVFNRTELYVVFSAQEIDDLPGYYIIIFTPKPRLKGEIAYFELDRVQLHKDERIQLLISIKTNSIVKTWFYYSQNPRLERFWGISAVDGDKLKSTELINAVRFVNKFIDDIPIKFVDNRWHDEVILPIDSRFSKQGKTLRLSWNLLQRLDNIFSAKGEFWVWKKDILVRENVEEALTDFSSMLEEKNIFAEFYFKIEFNKQQISIGSRMVASLQRVVAIQTNSGAIIPGHVTIGVSLKIN